MLFLGIGTTVEQSLTKLTNKNFGGYKNDFSKI